MFCVHCGKSIPDDSVFCPHCGGRLGKQDSSGSSSGTSSSYGIVSGKSQPANVNEEPHYEDEAGFSGVLISWALPLVGVIMYFVTRKTRMNAYYYLNAAIIGLGSAIVSGIVRHIMRH